MVRRPLIGAVVVGLAACATLEQAPPRSGFLSPETVETLVATAPEPRQGPEPFGPPPSEDRLWLALAHAEVRPPLVAQHFDCALGTRLAARPRPAIKRLMERTWADVEAVVRAAATRGRRARPHVANPAITPCQRLSPEISATSSWPAGPAVAATALGEMLVDLAPDRATALRASARTIAESRVVCRMNWPSDVEAGEVLGRELHARVAMTEAYRSDLAAAREEMRVARSEGRQNPGCAAERRALGVRPDAD